jgi:glycosyltransferase involved in cell wall biosynthesis
MPPLVSILIPAYNCERWVIDTIRSALGQKWSRREIIIVDDGSSDGTLGVLRQFESAEVKVIAQPNQGAAAARNAAFAAAQGDYIQWLDADDLLSPDKVSLQMTALAQIGSEQVLCSSEWGAFIHRPHRARFQPTSLWETLSPVEWLTRKLRDNLSMQTATWLVSRKLTEEAGPWDRRLLGDDDGEYFSRVVCVSREVRFVPGARVYYRRAVPSLSYIGRSQKKLEAQFLALQLYLQHIRSLDDGSRVREACVALLNDWRMSFYPERMDLFNQLESLAQELGGRIARPQISWKYVPIRTCLGWEAAKRSQYHYNRWKTSLARLWDGGLERLGL